MARTAADRTVPAAEGNARPAAGRAHAGGPARARHPSGLPDTEASTVGTADARNGYRVEGAAKLRALIFDVDGTLADTEREGHLVASNDAFAKLGIPLHWSWDRYRELLAIPGTRNRMRQALLELGTLTDVQVEETVAELFQLKQQRYIELVERLPLRPGVETLLRQAVERGVRLAIVTTSSEPQVRALLERRLPEFALLFDPILGQQSGPKVGDEGVLYARCLEELGLAGESVVAIEDAEDGLRAALRAGIACVVIPSGYSLDADFTGARLVAPTLEGVDLATLELLL